MADMVLIDNDILLKMCCYDAIQELSDAFSETSKNICVLGVARFVLRKVISKGRKIVNKSLAADRLEKLLDKLEEIEPSLKELELAATFEELAQRTFNMQLDCGESQLLAVLIHRCALLLLTGDKRAICAIECIVASSEFQERVKRRVVCLEQLVSALVQRHGAESLHIRICSEPDLDTAMAICFKCKSGVYSKETIAESLASYIRDLRQSAPTVLIDSDDLSMVIPQKDGIG